MSGLNSGYFNRAGEPVSMDEWAAQREVKSNWRVAEDTIEIDGFTLWVSTVFLGMDMGYGDQKLLYETMVFDQGARKIRNHWLKKHTSATTMPDIPTWEHDQEEDRWSTEEAAIAGHKAVVEAVKNHTYHDYTEGDT